MAGTFPGSFICLQIGAREHYAVPRALHQFGLLQALLTDTWVPPSSLRTRLFPGQRFQSRYHPQLQAAPVASPKLGSLAFELLSRRPGFPRGWPRTIARNRLVSALGCSPAAPPPAAGAQRVQLQLCLPLDLSAWPMSGAIPACSARWTPAQRRSGWCSPSTAATPISPAPGSPHQPSTGSTGKRSCSWPIASW